MGVSESGLRGKEWGRGGGGQPNRRFCFLTAETREKAWRGISLELAVGGASDSGMPHNGGLG